MGKAGRERVLEEFSWHAVAVATAAAYEDVIAEHASERLDGLDRRKGNRADR